MGKAAGKDRAMRALPKANRPRGVVFHWPRQQATQQAGMAISPCAAGLCSLCAIAIETAPLRRAKIAISRSLHDVAYARL